VPGEELEGVEGCLSVLNRLYRDDWETKESEVPQHGEVKTEELAVIGDGNAAFDLARAMRRLGAKVTIVSWFSEDRIPADREEIEQAKEEGIAIVDGTQVTAFSGTNGRLDHLSCRPTRPGKPDLKGIPWPVIIPGSEPFDLKFDRAIVAIGQAGSFPLGEPSKGDTCFSRT